MPVPPPGLPVPRRAEFDPLFVREYGSFLHNVTPGLPGMCSVCATPVSPSYLRCLRCEQVAPPQPLPGRSTALADRLAFMTYAVEGGQAYSVLRGYKLPNAPAQYWTAAATWAVWFLTRHGACAQTAAHIPTADWMWATVPSARSGRSGEHPLHGIVQRIWGTTHAEAVLELTPGAETQSRGYSPSKFTARRLPAGSHVILIDDSWTTGANVQSAATALKAAGAAEVSAMVLARLLNDSWEPTRQFIASGGLRSPFDPDACPWPGMPRHSA